MARALLAGPVVLLAIAGCGATKTITATSTVTATETQTVVHYRAKAPALPARTVTDVLTRTATQTITHATTHTVTAAAAAPPGPAVEGPGSTSHATDAEFCSTHQCIENFPNGNGSIVQCADGEWSHSGGLSGACSDHGGEQ